MRTIKNEVRTPVAGRWSVLNHSKLHNRKSVLKAFSLVNTSWISTAHSQITLIICMSGTRHVKRWSIGNVEIHTWWLLSKICWDQTYHTQLGDCTYPSKDWTSHFTSTYQPDTPHFAFAWATNMISWLNLSAHFQPDTFLRYVHIGGAHSALYVTTATVLPFSLLSFSFISTGNIHWSCDIAYLLQTCDLDHSAAAYYCASFTVWRSMNKWHSASVSSQATP